MKNYSALLATKLSTLNFSPECHRWFRDAGVRTVEDTEEHITLLLRSRYYTSGLLNEMVTVIREHMATDNDSVDSADTIEDKQQQISTNNVIINFLSRLVKAANRK